MTVWLVLGFVAACAALIGYIAWRDRHRANGGVGAADARPGSDTPSATDQAAVYDADRHSRGGGGWEGNAFG